MPHKEYSKIRAAIFGEPWAIVQDWLTLIIDVANRDYSNIELATAIREERALAAPPARVGSVAVIPVIGPIVPRGGIFANVSGLTSCDGIAAQIDDALSDRDIDRIILNFDSPGGQVTGVYELARYIRASCAVKPITAYVSGMADSAAYWLACACDRIVAVKTGTVGSIGVITTWTDDSAAKKAAGLKEYTFVSSPSPNKHLDPKTPAGRQEIQERIDAIAAIFMDEVARYRGVALQTVGDDFGKGSELMADDALAVGMIDEIGVFENALFADMGVGAATSLAGDRAMFVSGSPAAAGNKPRATDKNPDEDDDKPKGQTDPKDPEDDDKDSEAESDNPKPDDDEDDEEAKAAKKKARAKLKAEHPAAYRAGWEAYRAQINEIRAMGLVGHKALIENAVFKGNMTAGEVAIAHAMAEKGTREAMAKNRLTETANINVPVASVPGGGLNADEAEKKAIIAAMAGIKPQKAGQPVA